MKNLIILCILFSFISCSGNKKQILVEEKESATENITKIEKDTIIQSETTQVHNTPYLANAMEYLRNHNRYKDWDENDKRQVLVAFEAEKDGTTSHVKVRKSSGIEKLDKEAVRIVEGIKHDEPGTDINGNPVRVDNMVIIIFFPPK